MRLVGMTVIALVLGAVGCALNTDKLRTRAAYDLQCEAAQLQLTELHRGSWNMAHNGATYGVEGCGKRVTYVYSASGKAWLLNTDEQRSE